MSILEKLFRRPKYQTVPDLMGLIEKIRKTFDDDNDGSKALDAEKKKVLSFGLVSQLAYALKDENIQITDKREMITLPITDWRYFGESQYAETCRICKMELPKYSSLYRLDDMLHKDKSKVVVCINCFPVVEWRSQREGY